MGERALTVRDRIIAHLSAFGRFADEFECPEEMCQSGISAAVGKSRAHITLELNRMKESGLVAERMAHIKRAKSKRKTYLLTAQGQAINSEINGHLEGLSVDVMGEEPRTLSGNLAVEYLRANFGMTRIAAVDMVLESGGRLETASIRDRVENAKPGDLFMPPKPDNLLPRKEIHEMRHILECQTPNTIMLLGIPGIGKTGLLSELAWENGGKSKVMYRRVYPFDSQNSVLATMAEFLDGIGETGLRRSMAHPGNFDLSEARSHLAGCFARQRVLLMFDEYEQAPAILEPLFSMMAELVRDSGSCMVLASARKGNFYSLKNLALERDVKEVVLGPLDADSSLRLLPKGSNGAGNALIAGGHPLTLKLMATGIQPGTLAGFVEDEMLGGNSDMAKLCRFTAVLRRPFKPDDLELAGFANAPNIRKDLTFEPQPGGGYLLHPAISAIMLASAGKRMLRKMHAGAAAFCMSCDGDAHETLHHLVQSNDVEAAGEFIRGREDALLAAGNIEELAGMMELVMMESDSIELKNFASVALDRAGKWDRALRLAQEVADSAADARSVIKARTLCANILSKTGNLREALSALDSLPKSSGKSILHARAHYARASILRRMGRDREALKACDMAMAGGAGDVTFLAQCAMERAMIMAAMGKNDAALEQLEKAMSDFQRLDSLPDLIRCNINMGMALRSNGMEDEAIAALEKAVELSEKAGINRFMAHALANLTDLLNRKGDYSRSAELAERARNIFSGLGEPLMQAVAMLNLSAALAGEGKKERAIAVMDGAINLLEEKNLLRARESWLAECADILRGMGESKRAKAILKKYGT